MPTSISLNEYIGDWTKKEASHLLRRTTFGATHQQILDSITLGLKGSVEGLMNVSSLAPPISYDPDEEIVSEGYTWVRSVYPEDTAAKNKTNTARMRSLKAWLMEGINEEQEQVTIAAKMCLFWQNHFGVTATADARGVYDYVELLRAYCLGNFKQLVKEVTINPIMLVFLNGNSNSAQKPNENFARELLELFTIGKGPQIAVGDYTNYTEDDILECAKILTGYRTYGVRSRTENSYYSEFDDTKHNDTVKTLSSKFGNQIINPNGAGEYVDLIDVIFEQIEVSKHICRKIYRYFVSSSISKEVEEIVISGLALTLRTNNYEVQPVLVQLLSSEHFYDVSHRGCLIKSPLEMIFSIWNSTETKANYDVDTRYQMHLSCYHIAQNLDQEYLAPPSVAGWPVYYQAPSFSRLWLNASLIKGRFDVINWWVLYKGINKNDDYFVVEGLDFLKNLPDPANAVRVIQNMVDLFLPKGTTPSQLSVLKDVLTDGLPDFEWEIQYYEYVNNPNDPVYYEPVVKRVKETLVTLFLLPEFQTM